MSFQTLHEEIVERNKTIIKEKGKKAWFRYFIGYYKWQLLLVLLLTVFIIHCIVNAVTRKDTVLQVSFVNGTTTLTEEEFMADFPSFSGMNEKKEEALLDTSLVIDTENFSALDRQYVDKLYLMCSTGSVDVCITDESFFPTLADSGYLLDLRELFSEEEMEELSGRILSYESSHNDYEGSQPVGIDVSDSPFLKKTSSFPYEKAYFCVIVSSRHKDYAKSFYRYLYR